MALNIYPRSKSTTAQQPEAEQPLPEPAPAALAEAEHEPAATEPRRRARGTRGGRGRGGAAASAASSTNGVVESLEDTVEVTDAAAEAPPAKASRGSRAKASPASGDAPEAAEKPSRRKPAPAAEAPEEAPVAKSSRGAMRGPVDPTLVQLTRAVEQQTRQIEHLIKLQEDMAKQQPGGGATPRARTGVFVDVANVELALERLRTRVNWGKILESVTRGRELVRAVAYCPVHDDPSVSIETQRFVEPFLDHGYKIVTKPLKRFADGSVKANVDIELAMDIISMVDRLDVVVLASGDGDFQRLVEELQSRGIRVEVLSVGSSTAGSLRHAADQFIDLAGRLKEFRQ